MGFFGKTKDKGKEESKGSGKQGLPNLPDLPDLPESSKTPQNIEPPTNSALPSFPNSSFGKRMNQDSVKAAISKHEEKEMPNIPPIHSKKQRHESSIPPLMPPPSMIRGNTRPRSLEMSEWNSPTQKTKTAEPLFIKLDTFEKAVSSFNEVKLRMGEIETILRSIRELKTKEENEINDWEEEISTVRARLEQIDKEIFERME